MRRESLNLICAQVKAFVEHCLTASSEPSVAAAAAAVGDSGGYSSGDGYQQVPDSHAFRCAVKFFSAMRHEDGMGRVLVSRGKDGGAFANRGMRGAPRVPPSNYLLFSPVVSIKFVLLKANAVMRCAVRAFPIFVFRVRARRAGARSAPPVTLSRKRVP